VALSHDWSKKWLESEVNKAVTIRMAEGCFHQDREGGPYKQLLKIYKTEEEHNARRALSKMTPEEIQAAMAETHESTFARLSDTELVREWPLFAEMAAEIAFNPPPKGDVSVEHTNAFLRHAEQLRQVQCGACGGFGHTSEHCATWSRM